jgi:hypothetical protein
LCPIVVALQALVKILFDVRGVARRPVGLPRGVPEQVECQAAKGIAAPFDSAQGSPERSRGAPEPPTALLKFPNVDTVIYELGNFIDGKRSISDIRDAVSAEFAPISLPVVVEYFERLAKAGAVSLK